MLGLERRLSLCSKEVDVDVGGYGAATVDSGGGVVEI